MVDAKLALGALARRRRDETSRPRHAASGKPGEEFTDNWDHQWSSDQFPMRPERILSELRQAVPHDGFIVTDVGWNKNGVAQQFPITVPGTFITPSGLATMGFGPSAALGVKVAQPHRASVSLVGDGGFGAANPMVIATAMEAKLPIVWVVMDNAGFGTIAGLEKLHYVATSGACSRAMGRLTMSTCGNGATCSDDGVMIKSASELGPALRDAPASNVPTGHWSRWKMRQRRRPATGTSMTFIARAISLL